MEKTQQRALLAKAITQQLKQVGGLNLIWQEVGFLPGQPLLGELRREAGMCHSQAWMRVYEELLPE